MATILDTYDVSQLEAGGMLNEDVMQSIFDLSSIPLPFTSRVGRTSHDNPYFSWPVDRLQAPSTSNAVIDGSEGRSNQSFAPVYARVGNTGQISTKTLHVSVRLQESDTIGYQNELSRQVMRRGNELRRDVEAMAMLNNTSVTDTGDSGNAGETAGLEAWVSNKNVLDATVYDATAGNASQYRDLSTGGIAIGGWPAITPSGGVGNVAAVDYTSVTAANAITEVAMLDVVQQLYENGYGEDRNYVAMCRPALKRRVSSFFFSSSARIGTLVSQEGDSTQPRIANGAIDLIKTDFGVIELTPNRLMQLSNASPACSSMAIFDPGMISLSYLHGYRTYPLARTGLLEKREIAVDWGLRVHNWEALGWIFGIDETAAMTAS